MKQEREHDDAATIMRRINRIWLDGQVDDIAPFVHPEIVMVSPGFMGRIQGAEEFLAGFRDFRQNARIHEFRDYDYQADVVSDTAVVTFLYDMVYELHGERYRSTGRDLWVFENHGRGWMAVWRTMLDMEEKAA